MLGSARKDVLFGVARVYTVTVPGPKWKSWLTLGDATASPSSPYKYNAKQTNLTPPVRSSRRGLERFRSGCSGTEQAQSERPGRADETTETDAAAKREKPGDKGV